VGDGMAYLDDWRLGASPKSTRLVGRCGTLLCTLSHQESGILRGADSPAKRLYRHLWRQAAGSSVIGTCAASDVAILGRRDAQKKYSLSANLIQLWLTQFDHGELTGEEVEASLVIEYEAKIAALERKVGQLTMETRPLSKKHHTCAS